MTFFNGHFSKCIFAEGRFPATPSFWKHPSKTNIPDFLFTHRDKNQIPVTKPGGEALEFQGGFEYIGIVYYF